MTELPLFDEAKYRPPATLVIDGERPAPFPEHRELDLLDLYEDAVLKIHNRPPTRWRASEATLCPRMVWYRHKGILPPVDLTSWVRMRIGKAIEFIEAELQALALPQRNTKKIRDVLRDYPQLQAAVEGALLAQYVIEDDEGETIIKRRFTPDHIKDFYIEQLPFHIEVPDLKLPISCVADTIVLLNDRPLLLEIKSTFGYGARLIKASTKDGGKPFKVSWAVQVALYAAALGIPARVHVWARDDVWRHKFSLDWRSGHFCVNGYPYFVNGMDPVDWAFARFRALEEYLDRDEPPGEIAFLNEGALGLVLPEDFPTHDEERYVLLFDENFKPIPNRGRGKTRERSEWCHRCEYQVHCYGEILDLKQTEDGPHRQD